MERLPSTVFDTASFRVRDRYDLWRDSFSVAFGYDLSPDVAPKAFHARIENVLLGPAMLAHYLASAASYERSAVRIAKDGVDMVMLQLYLGGPARYEHNGNAVRCGVGDLVLMDLAQPLNTWHDTQHNLTLCLPRALVVDAVPSFEQAHLGALRASHPLAGILRSHLLAVQQAVPLLPASEGSQIAYPTIDLALSAIRAIASKASDPVDVPRWVQRSQTDAVIDSMLPNPDLSPALVAATANCSRSRLYALYQQDGGVASFIKRRRLKATLRDLASPGPRRSSVAETADRHGFRNLSSFSRAFKAEFGMTPTDARQQGVEAIQARPNAAEHVRRVGPRAYEYWVKHLLSSA